MATMREAVGDASVVLQAQLVRDRTEAIDEPSGDEVVVHGEGARSIITPLMMLILS